jgi:hypothetical protein
MKYSYTMLNVCVILLFILVFQPLDIFSIEHILKDNNTRSPTVLVKLNNFNDSSAKVINPIVITPL